MSHNFLLELYKEIDCRLEKALDSVRDGNPTVSTHFEEGRIDTLNEFKSFLGKKYDVKLPKRLQKRRLMRRIGNE